MKSKLDYGKAPCRCRDCGAEFESLIQGKAHVVVEHGWNKCRARERLVRI